MPLTRDFSKLIEMCLSGHMDLNPFVTKTNSVTAVEEAFHKME